MGSNPAPATTLKARRIKVLRAFCCSGKGRWPWPALRFNQAFIVGAFGAQGLAKSTWFKVTVLFNTQSPFHTAEQVLLESLADFDGVQPIFYIGIGADDVFAMAQRGEEHFSCAVAFAPGNAKMS